MQLTRFFMSAPHLNLAGAGAAAPEAEALTLRGVLCRGDRRPAGWFTILGTSGATVREPLKELERAGRIEACGATTRAPGLALATGATQRELSAERAISTQRL